MATIKDIALLAGVSHGTVSNVLNGRGNVSVEKITLVENAAKKLGYTINAQARQLRKGKTKRVGIVVPQVKLKKYSDLFLGLEQELQSRGYEVNLYYSDNLNYNEEQILRNIESTNPMAVVLVSTFTDTADNMLGDVPIIFAERKPHVLPANAVFCGFDYEKAGKELAARCSGAGKGRVAVFAGHLKYSNCADFVRGVEKELSYRGIEYRIFSGEDFLGDHRSFEFWFDREGFEAVIAMEPEMISSIFQAAKSCGKMPALRCYVLAGKSVLDETGIEKYELNYRLRGKRIGKYIEQIEAGGTLQQSILELENDGFCDRKIAACAAGQELKILMISGPTSRALGYLLPQFTEQTGIRVRLMEVNYDELYQMAKNCTISSPYDLIRMDMAWMSELGRQVYRPLDERSEWYRGIRSGLSDSLSDDYYRVGNSHVAFPFDPSVQILFYRKDLFESPKICREFYEKYKRQLEVPKTFRELDEIARFFTRTYNETSPVRYGITQAFGGAVVAACDYLPRLKAESRNIFAGSSGMLLKNEKVLQTLDDYKKAFDYTNKETNLWWRDTVECFANGQVAMNIVFSNYASILLKGENSEMLGKIGFAEVPGGHPMLGGGVIGISRYSQKQKPCEIFLQWLYSEKTSALITYLGGYVNHKKLQENLEILELYPWIEDMERAFTIGWRREEEREVDGFSEFAFEEILGNAVRFVVSGIMEKEEALEAAQERCAWMMKR